MNKLLNVIGLFAAGALLAISLAGCTALLPLAVVAIESAPSIIQGVELVEQHDRAAAAAAQPAAHLVDDVPLIEPNDVLP